MVQVVLMCKILSHLIAKWHGRSIRRLLKIAELLEQFLKSVQDVGSKSRSMLMHNVAIPLLESQVRIPPG